MPTIRWTIGDVVRKLRSDKGWKQRDLAKAAEIAVTAANRLENTSDLSDQRTIHKAAKALDVPVSLLYRYAEFTSLFAELNEAQQGRVLDLMQEFAKMQVENPQPTASSNADGVQTNSESESPTKVRRTR